MEEMAENMEVLAETMEEMAGRFSQILAGQGLQDFFIRVRLLRLVRILRYLKATLDFAFNFKEEKKCAKITIYYRDPASTAHDACMIGQLRSERKHGYKFEINYK